MNSSPQRGQEAITLPGSAQVAGMVCMISGVWLQVAGSVGTEGSVGIAVGVVGLLGAEVGSVSISAPQPHRDSTIDMASNRHIVFFIVDSLS